ncbi:hypothetical protein NSQ62_07960 [Solibacillus sp. FSL H8-0523]|uniref:hypothetical protein n=1 Tax=Solibacillus sp. FSL H8-0523 TaxID=2954511 RepID=UPI0031018922
MKTTVTLTTKEVEQILTEYVSKKFKIVGKVKLEVGKELRGHYTNEHYETVFKWAIFEVEL